MAEKREYRSAVRSRKLIRQAFMDLLKEKPFEKITVTDIVKRAEINRSTFYAHYPDVLGLLEEIQNEIITYTEKMMDDIDFRNFMKNPEPLLKEVVNLAMENVELYRLLSTSNMAAKQLLTIKNVLIERTLNTVEFPELELGAFEKEFAVRFFMGGAADLYMQWLNGEVDCSIEELTSELAKMIVRVSKDYL